jgi:2-oxoglutarate ferredoxin oxidoreductase subunit gamma
MPGPLSRTAIELGSERVANIVALGALVALTNLCDGDVLAHKVRVEAPRSLVHLNLDALAAGAKLSGAALTAN